MICQPCTAVECVADDDFRYTLQDLPPDPEPLLFFNAAVFFNPECEEGAVLTYDGTLPNWITIVNNQLVGAANTFQAISKADANADAQAQLDAFAQAAIAGELLVCQEEGNVCVDGLGDLGDNVYQIQGYVDGVIQPGDGVACTSQPTWSGILPFFQNAPEENQGWYALDDGPSCIGGFAACRVKLYLDCDLIPDTPVWVFNVTDGTFWDYTAIKEGGQTPEGVYLYSSGSIVSPASITIEQGAGVTNPGFFDSCGG